ncbi:MAG TPA: hypothetical protein VNE62_08210 [Actinomycetota bacterium]|nr:hypothetical protein [Actinomycetota bacterium]
MPTRQQRRVKARAPLKKKHRGQLAFIAILVGLLALGTSGIVYSFFNKPEITRGAQPGDHWHAKYRIEICGAPVTPFRQSEGEIHTHDRGAQGDGQIHIHPKTPAFSLDNANLEAFLGVSETFLTREKGRNSLLFSDGTDYKDGEKCQGSDAKHKLVVQANGKPVKGHPGKFVLHHGDDIVIRFGPKPSKGASPMPNPQTAMQQRQGGPPGAGGLPGPEGAPPGAPTGPSAEGAPPEPGAPPAGELDPGSGGETGTNPDAGAGGP